MRQPYSTDRIRKEGIPLAHSNGLKSFTPVCAKSLVSRVTSVRRLLDKYGYAETESVHNEWNYRKDWSNAFVRDVQTWIGVKGAALDAAAMCAMSRTSVDMMMYYDAAPDAVFNGLFDFYTRKPLPAYWTFFYWGDMLKKGTGLKVSVDGADNNDVEAYAAIGRDGSKGLMVACYDDAVPLPDGMKTVVVRLPGQVRNLRLRLVDSKGANRSVQAVLSDGRVTLTLERLSVAYLTWTDSRPVVGQWSGGEIQSGGHMPGQSAVCDFATCGKS